MWLLAKRPVYIRFDRNTIRARDVIDDNSVSFGAFLCMDDQRTIVSVGHETNREDVTVHRAFNGSEAFVENPPVAAKLIQHAIACLNGNRWLIPNPIVVLHPEADTLGDAAMAAVEDIGRALYAKALYVHRGPLLSDDDIRTLVGMR